MTAIARSCRVRRPGLVRDERGQGMVEFALILPVLLLILVGIIEFGLIFYNVSSVRQGVREAGRQGSVGNFGPANTTCTTFAVNGGTAPPVNAPIQQLVCLTKNQLGVPAGTRIMINIVSASDLTTSDTWEVGNGLVVCAIYPLSSVTKLFNPFIKNRASSTKSVFRIEKEIKSPDTVPQGGGEDPPSGQTWSPECTP